MRPDAGGLRAGLPAQTRRNYRAGIQRLPLLFQALELPVIAAVNGPAIGAGCDLTLMRSEEHTSELQSLMRTSYAVFCLKKKSIKLKNSDLDSSKDKNTHTLHTLEHNK